jgi:hypothetical protein
MALSAEQYQELVVSEVGDSSDLVTDNVPLYWSMHSGKPTYLRYLWTKLATIDLLLGQPAVREAVNYTEDGQSQSLHQKFESLTEMRKSVMASIASYRGNRAPVVSEMAARTPVASPTGWPDANSGDYRGDPNTSWAQRLRP